MDEERDRAFEYRLIQQPPIEGMLLIERVVVRRGPVVCKTAELQRVGDPQSGELAHTKLALRSYRAKRVGAGWDFDEAVQSWSCQDGEIDRLRALLDHDLLEPGTYRLVGDDDTFLGELSERLEPGAEGAGEFLRSLLETLRGGDFAQAIQGLDAAAVLAEAVSRQSQHAALEMLRAVVEDAASTEHDINRVLRKHYWIFGGRYVGTHARRQLVVQDQIDIPLIRADGSLHVVELKQANLPRLVRRHRSHVIVGPEVHEAVSQAMNYLRTLDEQRDTIAQNLGIDCRRASATVVLGHVNFLNDDVTEEELRETLRTYNSHLARVQVLTYDELIAGAENSLAISVEPEDVMGDWDQTDADLRDAGHGGHVKGPPSSARTPAVTSDGTGPASGNQDPWAPGHGDPWSVAGNDPWDPRAAGGSDEPPW